jgi:predicted dehydrogenase
MAATLEEAQQMARVAQECGRRLMVYQPHRAEAETVALQAILGQGLLGEVYLIKRAVSRYARRNDWQAFRKNAGGMLNNYGAHYIDQFLYLAASRARRIVCALRATVTLGDADDVVKALIETESGMIFDLDINMAAALPMPPWQVFGKLGAASLDAEANVWRVRYVRREDLPATPVHTNLAAEARRYGSGEKIPWQDRLFPCADFQPVDFYAKCYEFYAQGRAAFVPIEQTLEVMRVLAEARRDASASDQWSVFSGQHGQ